MTSLIIVFLIGAPLIKIFSEKMITGPIRQDGPIDHIVKKSGTPTMGGLIILSAILIPTVLFSKIENIYIIVMLISTLWLGVIGFLVKLSIILKHL